MEFPKNEARTLLAWMREQMYGDKPTEWTNGNEHDHMLDCADLIQTLLDRTKAAVGGVPRGVRLWPMVEPIGGPAASIFRGDV